jgi:hypothetical protein
MSRRIPLYVAVVGALLVGGATTGTTGATWTGQRQLAATAVGSGQMGFATTTPAGVTVPQGPGSATTSFVLDDTSTGKNLRQRITAQVAGTPTGVTATVGTSCPGAASVQVDTTPASAEVSLCVRVTGSATATAGTVTLNLSGAQQPSGWTTPVSVVSVPVTVGVVPTAPNLTCTGPNQNGFGWAAVTGAASYTIASSGSQNGTYTDRATQTQTQYLPTVGGQSTTFFRVRATNTAGSSPNSNAVRITRSGSAYTCAVLP